MTLRPRSHPKKQRSSALAICGIRFSAALAAVGLLAGCATTPALEERAARDRVAELADIRSQLSLPALQADSAPEDYLRFALLKNPRVVAAHADWRAAVEAITPARSLPDPKFTFEADIADMVMSLMPGLMFDLMGPGKRSAMGREAAAESDVTFQRYRAAVLQVAADVKKTWADLAYLDTALALRAETLTVLDRSLAFAQADYVTGNGMGTLEAQVNARTETERIRLELANLADQREATRARFKAALGLRREESSPPWPERFPSGPLSLDEDALWAQALRQNPELGVMRAMVGMAVAEIDVSRKTRVPDIEIGVMADFKADPLMARPTAALTLPIWRDKIAATIAASESRREAAAARLSAEEINLAAELAQMSAMIREAGRMIDFIDTTALPGIERALDSTRSGYQAGMASLSALPAMELMALGMRLEKAAAERERARAFADLSLLVSGAMPDGAPVLAAESRN